MLRMEYVGNALIQHFLAFISDNTSSLNSLVQDIVSHRKQLCDEHLDPADLNPVILAVSRFSGMCDWGERQAISISRYPRAR